MWLENIIIEIKIRVAMEYKDKESANVPIPQLHPTGQVKQDRRGRLQSGISEMVLKIIYFVLCSPSLPWQFVLT